MMLLEGWWSVYFPWDHQALLKFHPSELVWFLLLHIIPSETEHRALSPLRVVIILLAMQPWYVLIGWCHEYEVLEKIMGI
jgi:hypothetical protein